MNRTRHLVVLSTIALGLLAASAPALAQNSVKIGVFDVQRVTQDTAEGAKIQARLTALKDRKGAELKKLQEELEKMNQEFAGAGLSLSEEKKKDMMLRIQRKQDELDSAQKAANRELQIEVEAAQDAWQRRVIEVVNAYGRNNNFSVIIPSDAALYFNPAIDVTADLIKAIDAQPEPTAAAPAPPAPAAGPGKK